MKKIVLLSILSLVSTASIFGCNNGKKKPLIKEVSKIKFKKSIDDFKSCMDGRYLAVKFVDGSLQLYDLKNYAKGVFKERLQLVFRSTLSEDRKWLFVLLFAGKGRLYNIQVYDLENLKNSSKPVLSIKDVYGYKFSKDSKYLAVCVKNGYLRDLCCYNLKKNVEIVLDSKQLRCLRNYNFIKNKYLFTSYDSDEDRCVIHDLENKNKTEFLDKYIYSLSFSPRCKYRVSQKKGYNHLHLRDMHNKEDLLSLNEISSFKFSLDDRYLVINKGQSNKVQLYDLKKKNGLFGGELKGVWSYGISANGKYFSVVFGEGGNISDRNFDERGALQLYDLKGKKPKGVFGEKLGNISYLFNGSGFKFSPDGGFFLVNFTDDSSHLYGLLKPFVKKPLLKLKACLAQDFSKNGEFLFITCKKAKMIKKFKLPGKKNPQAKKDFHERLKFLVDEMES